ncbi:glycoside hydrolase family 2 TIM barrel-domain containing protein [Kamptonema cortianum]|nr:glycoside hydrolase family 2 TIM barrel-domain containing protein [Kamptonema cortianum]
MPAGWSGSKIGIGISWSGFLREQSLPEKKTYSLECDGLDHKGWVRLNGKELGEFNNAHIPHHFDLTAAWISDADNLLEIIFDCPPRWLGQVGYSSQIRDWKPRFYYNWDWIPRCVQVGVWDQIRITARDFCPLTSDGFHTEYDHVTGLGSVHFKPAQIPPGTQSLRIRMIDGGKEILSENHPVESGDHGFHSASIPVRCWWPNGCGANDRPLYDVRIEALAGDGRILGSLSWSTGFKQIKWLANSGAPADALPWVCEINGHPLFLAGVNWTPIRANFADVTVQMYRDRITTYRDLGFNILRVWGGAFLEKECFYRICDELGLMIWQEFPLSSSGLDNCPPEDEAICAEMGQIARSFVLRRQHHAALLMWGGGNELMDFEGIPLTAKHRLIHTMVETAQTLDPCRRCVPTSPSGPQFFAFVDKMGTGIHHDIHGPWMISGPKEEWERYWAKDDALFRSEAGCPGASDASLLEQFSAGLPLTPGTITTDLWRRTYWWIEWPAFIKEEGHEPRDLAEYVAWSQKRQADALAIATRACKERFPACGGIIFWMGHDCFPCPANTSLLDFHGHPKPAALAIAQALKG